jgi:hypothetical protein
MMTQHPAERAAAATNHAPAGPLHGARKRLGGTRPAATDLTQPAGGEPDEVRGPAGDVLLLTTG